MTASNDNFFIQDLADGTCQQCGIKIGGENLSTLIVKNQWRLYFCGEKCKEVGRAGLPSWLKDKS
jgi:hypothetical protein